MAHLPRHAAPTAAAGHALRASLALLLALVAVLGFSTASFADAPNNGTVKIDEETLTSDGGPSNNPKPLGCTFAIDFYNFPSATSTALISFESKSSGPGTYDPVSETDLSGPRTVTFGTSDGPGSVLEHTAALYTVDPNGGLSALPNGAFLLKVTVQLQGDRNFVKHKVFMLECLPDISPPPPPPPATVPDLAITKGGTDAALVGAAGSYTLGVSNVGTAAVTEPIVVTDTLPAGVMPTAAVGDGFVCTVNAQLVTCTRDADLAPEASTAPITVSVTFGSAAVPSVLNTARVTPVTGETNLDNNVDTHPTIVTVPVVTPTQFDLAVDKAGPATAVTGSSINYVINVINNGPDASPAYVLTDQLSAGQIATAVTAGNDYVCGISADGRTVTCTRAAALAAGQSASPVTVTVTVLAGPASSIADTASVPVLTGDTNAGNNTDTVTTTVPAGQPIIENPIQNPIQNPVFTPTLVPAEVPVQTAVVGPPTGLAPVVTEQPVSLPELGGITPGLPAVLPEQAPVPLLPLQGAPQSALAGPVAVAKPAAAAQARALPFTGSAVDGMLMTSLALLVLGAGALMAAARTPKTRTI